MVLETVLKTCKFKRCISLNCVHSMSEGRVQKDLKNPANKRRVFNEFVQKIQKKEILGLPCIPHKMDFVSSRIKEEGKETEGSLKCAFLEEFLPSELVRKLNQKGDIDVTDCIQMSLAFSLNQALQLSSDAEVREYFKRMGEFFDLLREFPQAGTKKFLTIFVDKLCWEFLHFFEHVKNQSIDIEQLVLSVKFLSNLSILFDFDFFTQLDSFHSILNLFKWKNFTFLFSESGDSNDNILTINENEQKLKLQTAIARPELERLVEVLLNFITINLLEEEKFRKLKPATVGVLRPVCSLMDVLWNLNQYLSERVRLDEAQFVNAFLSDDFKFKDNLLFYLRPKIMTQKRFGYLRKFFQKDFPVGSFNFLDHPFLYSVERKVEILHFESSLEQQLNFREGFNIMDLLRGGQLSLGLDLQISRGNILEDALSQLNKPFAVKNLRKPLKVTFRGEPGMDEGGLTKEFFHLLTQRLFDPNFGMFTVKNEAFCWFKIDSMAFNLNYELIGMLMGLAIYNKTLLDVRFPLALYKKLLIEHSTRRKLKLAPKDLLGLEDLREFDPQLHSTLSNILQMDLPEDNEFGITFEISYESWGVKKTHALVPGGASVTVTNANKDRFVKKYLDWTFNASVAKEFKYFSVGFSKVLGDSVLQFFSAEELLMTICGKATLNFEELRQGASYHDGFAKDSQTVQDFWRILLEEFDQKDRRHFLKFLTGNDRAPLRGLKEIGLKISK